MVDPYLIKIWALVIDRGSAVMLPVEVKLGLYQAPEDSGLRLVVRVGSEHYRQRFRLEHGWLRAHVRQHLARYWPDYFSVSLAQSTDVCQQRANNFRWAWKWHSTSFQYMHDERIESRRNNILAKREEKEGASRMVPINPRNVGHRRSFS